MKPVIKKTVSYTDVGNKLIKVLHSKELCGKCGKAVTKYWCYCAYCGENIERDGK